MDLIVNNDGFHHILEEIFMDLDYQNILKCQKVCSFWESILKNPVFWLKKCVNLGLGKEHEKLWAKLLKTLKDPSLKENMTSELIEIHNGVSGIFTYCQSHLPPRCWGIEGSAYCRKSWLPLPDFYVYIGITDEINSPFFKIYQSKDLALIENYLETVDSSIVNEEVKFILEASKAGEIELLKILITFTNNPNPMNSRGFSAIQLAVDKCHVEVVKILAPLVDNPNAPYPNGDTPIHRAVRSKKISKSVEIIRILAPRAENPNALDTYGLTPIHVAVSNGKTEVIKILAPLTENPNVPDINGYTPIQKAAEAGFTEAVRILAPLTENPNAPNPNGLTPILVAAEKGYTEIIKILFPLSDNVNDSDGTTPLQIGIFKKSVNKHLGQIF